MSAPSRQQNGNDVAEKALAKNIARPEKLDTGKALTKVVQET